MNWAVLAYLSHLSKGKSFTKEQWSSMTAEEKYKVKLDQRIASDIYSRNKQVCIPGSTKKLHSLVSVKNKDGSWSQVRKVLPASNYKVENDKIVFVDSPNIAEQGFQRINDMTYSAGFTQKVLDIEEINKKPKQEVLWHDGRKFIDWYFASTEERYPKYDK